MLNTGNSQMFQPMSQFQHSQTLSYTGDDNIQSSNPTPTIQTSAPINIGYHPEPPTEEDHQVGSAESQSNHVQLKQGLNPNDPMSYSQQQLGETFKALMHLQQQNKIVEDINASLLWKIEEKDREMKTLERQMKSKDETISNREKQIKELKTTIKKKDVDSANARRSVNFNEHENKMLREQLAAFKSKCEGLENKEKAAKDQICNDLGQKVEEMQQKNQNLQRIQYEHNLELNVERDKYQDLLHRFTDLQSEHTQLQLNYQALEQECQTVRSFSDIQTGQIETLQSEISRMVGKLEDVQQRYEIELQENDQRMVAAQQMAVQQMKQVQNMMRQEQIESQKEIMKLREQLQFKQKHQEVMKMQQRQPNINQQWQSMSFQVRSQPVGIQRSLQRSQSHDDSDCIKKNVRQELDSKSFTESRRVTESGDQGESEQSIHIEIQPSIRKSIGSIRSHSHDAIKQSSAIFFTQDYQSALQESDLQGLLTKSPLINWLRSQLMLAWANEKALKDQIQKYAGKYVKEIKEKTKAIKKQQVAVRCEVEMWQMRNEEMETRVLRLGERLWSLKEICKEQQQQLKRYSIERDDFLDMMQKIRRAGEYHLYQSKSYYYDLYAQIKSSDNFQSICRNMQNAKDNFADFDEDKQNLEGQMEQLKDICELRKQEIDNLTEKNNILQTELNDFKNNDGKSQQRSQEMMFEIFKKVDKETCDALHQPTIEQLYKLILSKMNAFMVKRHDRRDEIDVLEDQHRQELNYQRQQISELEHTLKTMRDSQQKVKSRSKKSSSKGSMKVQYDKEKEQLFQQFQEVVNENQQLQRDLHNSQTIVGNLEQQLSYFNNTNINSYQQLNPRHIAETQSSLSVMNNQGQHPQLQGQTISSSGLGQPITNNLANNHNMSRTDNYSSIMNGSQHCIEDRPSQIKGSRCDRIYNIQENDATTCPVSNSREEDGLGEQSSVLSSQVHEVQVQTKRKPPTEGNYMPTFYNNYDETSRNNNMFSEFTDGSMQKNANNQKYTQEPPLDIHNIQNPGTFDMQTDNIIRNIQAQSDPFGQSGSNWHQMNYQDKCNSILDGRSSAGGQTQTFAKHDDPNIDYFSQSSIIAPPLQQRQSTMQRNFQSPTKEQSFLIQQIKEDIIDALNDLKQQDQVWKLSSTMKGQCDQIIKKMVVSANEGDYLPQVFDHVRSLFDVLRSIMKHKQQQQVIMSDSSPSLNEPSSMSSNRLEADRKMIKNIELVIDVYKRAGDRIGRVGEREWREVIEQQRFVLEAILKVQNDKLQNGKSSKTTRAELNFSSALSDFQLCLTRALDNVVCKDNITGSEPYLQTTNTFTCIAENMRSCSMIESLSDIQATPHPMLKEKILCQFRLFRDNSSERPLSQFSHDLLGIMIGNSQQEIHEPQVNITIQDVRHYATTILRHVRDELAFSQKTFLETINQDMSQFEQAWGGGRLESTIKSMKKEEIMTLVKSQAQIIMRLKANEATMIRFCQQIRIFMDATPLCSFQGSLVQISNKICEQEWIMARDQRSFSITQAQLRTDTFMKVNRIIQELIENIKREAKTSIGAISTKSGQDQNTDGIGSTIKEAYEPINQLLQVYFSNLMAENAVIANLM